MSYITNVTSIKPQKHIPGTSSLIVIIRWLGVFLDSIAGLIVFFATVFAATERDNITAGLVGLSISYAIQVGLVITE